MIRASGVEDPLGATEPTESTNNDCAPAPVRKIGKKKGTRKDGRLVWVGTTRQVREKVGLFPFSKRGCQSGLACCGDKTQNGGH